MHSILQNNLFFIKEHVGMFKAANNYDIHDPKSGAMTMTCREEKLGGFTKFLRFTKYKRMTPFNVEIKTAKGEKVLTVKRGISFFVSTVEVLDENDMLVGTFKQKFWSVGGKFNVFDFNGNELCALKGKWTSWDFKFVRGKEEFAHVSKEWAGLGRELFTTADNYMLEVYNQVGPDDPIRILILGAVVCIDMVLKE
jgi:uncharacterized protein YxjI